MFKKLFGGEKKPQVAATVTETIEDLIVLERYDEAAARLKAKLKDNPEDLHSHLKLGEVYAELKDFARAVDCYCFVADELASDGFYDKAVALLVKAKRFAPLDPQLDARAGKYKLAKEMERSRVQALEGLRQAGGATAALVVQRFWHRVAPAPLARNLPPEELKRLFSVMQMESYPEGTQLGAAGAVGDLLYFLLDGTVRASYLTADGQKSGIRDFGPGDVVGESGLLERRPWAADVDVIEAVKALVLDREGLERSLAGNPDPRSLLLALRAQGNDRVVENLLQQVRRA